MSVTIDLISYISDMLHEKKFGYYLFFLVVAIVTLVLHDNAVKHDLSGVAVFTCNW